MNPTNYANYSNNNFIPLLVDADWQYNHHDHSQIYLTEENNPLQYDFGIIFAPQPSENESPASAFQTSIQDLPLANNAVPRTKRKQTEHLTNGEITDQLSAFKQGNNNEQFSYSFGKRPTIQSKFVHLTKYAPSEKSSQALEISHGDELSSIHKPQPFQSSDEILAKFLENSAVSDLLGTLINNKKGARWSQEKISLFEKLAEELFSDNKFRMENFITIDNELHVKETTLAEMIKKLNFLKPDEEKKILQACVLAAHFNVLINKMGIAFPFKKINPCDVEQDFDIFCQAVNSPSHRKSMLDSLSGKKWQLHFPLKENHPYHPCSEANLFAKIQIDPNFVGSLTTTTTRAISSRDIHRGRILSNSFTQEERLKVDGSTKSIPSPVSAWNDECTRFRYLKKMFLDMLRNSSYGNQKSISSELLSKVFRLKYCASQFMPGALPLIIEILANKNLLPQSGIKVLDPTGGWCDRLVGALADKRITHYLYNDTNPALPPLAKKIVEAYNKNKTNVLILNEMAETLSPSHLKGEGFSPETKFDLLFTSPPYFNLEMYPGDNGSMQYLVKKGRFLDPNSSVKNWRDKFLHKMLEQTDKLLNSKGVVAVNIDDVRNIYKNINETFLRKIHGKESSVIALSDMLNEKLMKMGYKWLGVIGYTLKKGGNCGEKSDANAEPIWVWQKP